MRYFQASTFYDQYLNNFHARHPELLARGHKQQLQALLNDGFGAQHLFGAYMHQVGYESQLVIPNDPLSQSTWAKENGVALTDNWKVDIVRAQINHFKPDIFYATMPLPYLTKQFIDSLSHRPKFIAGWSVFAPPAGTDYSPVDLMLTTNYCAAEENIAAGVTCIENFLPGMPDVLLPKFFPQEKVYDVVFCGQVTPEYQNRIRFLQRIAQVALNTGKIKPGFFCLDFSGIPPEVAHFRQDPRWGVDMLRTIAQGKIGLHKTIDSSGKLSGAMRLFETTFAGSLFLGEDDASLRALFTPGTEVATFFSEDDAIEKILFYSSDESERARIAAGGQERCLRDHSMSTRVKQFDRLLQYYITKVKQPPQ